MRRYGLLIVSLLAAAGCIRLGVWQVSRLRQRRASNAVLRARLAQFPVDLDGPLPDSLPWHRAIARGVYDFDHQILIANRTKEGLPGVYVVTPLRLASGRVVLVERGWMYSEDGRTVGTIPRSTEDTVSGLIVDAPAPSSGAAGWPKDTVWPKVVRQLDVGYLTFNYAPITAVLRRDSVPGLAPLMQPIPQPVLDDGPHLSYAIQWFSFALIALVGGGIWALRGERREKGEEGPAEDPL